MKRVEVGVLADIVGSNLHSPHSRLILVSSLAHKNSDEEDDDNDDKEGDKRGE
jgi:hypothetical protein